MYIERVPETTTHVTASGSFYNWKHGGAVYVWYNLLGEFVPLADFLITDFHTNIRSGIIVPRNIPGNVG